MDYLRLRAFERWRLRALVDDFGERWVIETLAFNPILRDMGTLYRLRAPLACERHQADDIEEMFADRRSIVHRLWEPLAETAPRDGYAAIFDSYDIAAGFVRGMSGSIRFRRQHQRSRLAAAGAKWVRNRSEKILSRNSPAIFAPASKR